MPDNLSLIINHLSLDYDVIIIGAGAAGLSAGLWCDELGFKTLLLEENSEIGGQLLWVYNPIRNHLGTESAADGRELRDKFARQIENRGFTIKTNAKVATVDLINKQIILATEEQLSARFLILATGVRRRTLNIPGEADFKNRGLLESGKRDAPLVAGKTVCVVGGGDAAAENALILAEQAAKVYLVHRSAKLRARAEFLEKIKFNSRIETLTETKAVQIIGDQQITAVKLSATDQSQSFEIAVDAVLLRIGVEPNSDCFRGQLKTDSSGYVVVNSRGETSVKNVLAIGDITNPLAPTVSGAVGAGATAAKIIAAQSI